MPVVVAGQGKEEALVADAVLTNALMWIPVVGWLARGHSVFDEG